MYSSSYSKSYGSSTTGSSRQAPIGSSSGGGGGSSGIGNSASNNSERPSTLNLPSGATATSSTLSAAGSSSGVNLPSKPSRYTPVYPTLGPNASNKSSSYTNLPTGSPYSSTYAQQQRVPSSQQESQSQVITAPPKSILGQHGYESRYQYYQPPMKVTQQQPLSQSQAMQQHQSSYASSGPYSQQHSNIASSNVTSKSAHNLLIDSIPDVFCLSCPPAEFKFSDAYRAKTLPRTGKEV
jgi:hypothetical protein